MDFIMVMNKCNYFHINYDSEEWKSVRDGRYYDVWPLGRGGGIVSTPEGVLGLDEGIDWSWDWRVCDCGSDCGWSGCEPTIYAPTDWGDIPYWLNTPVPGGLP